MRRWGELSGCVKKFCERFCEATATPDGGGVWLSWLLEGDVRVRLSTMTGDQAVVSALTFDPAP